jgi:hypothetical protein
MPRVGKKKFPYTKKGLADAKAYAKKNDLPIIYTEDNKSGMAIPSYAEGGGVRFYEKQAPSGGGGLDLHKSEAIDMGGSNKKKEKTKEKNKNKNKNKEKNKNKGGGKDGKDGRDGRDGVDGEDGVTRIEQTDPPPNVDPDPNPGVDPAPEPGPEPGPGPGPEPGPEPGPGPDPGVDPPPPGDGGGGGYDEYTPQSQIEPGTTPNTGRPEGDYSHQGEYTPQSQTGGDAGGATPQSAGGGEGYIPQSQQAGMTNPNAGRLEGNYSHETPGVPQTQAGGGGGGGAAADAISGAGSGVADAAGGAASGVADAAGSAASAVGEGVGEAASAVGEGVADAAGEAASAVGEGLADAAGEAASSIGEGIADAASEAVDAAAGKKGMIVKVNRKGKRPVVRKYMMGGMAAHDASMDLDAEMRAEANWQERKAARKERKADKAWEQGKEGKALRKEQKSEKADDKHDAIVDASGSDSYGDNSMDSVAESAAKRGMIVRRYTDGGKTKKKKTAFKKDGKVITGHVYDSQDQMNEAIKNRSYRSHGTKEERLNKDYTLNFRDEEGKIHQKRFRPYRKGGSVRVNKKSPNKMNRKPKGVAIIIAMERPKINRKKK